MGLALDDLKAPSRGDSVWYGAVTWYVGVTAGEPPEYVLGDGSVTLTVGQAPGGAYTWYSMTLPPLTWSSTVNSIWEDCLGASLALLDGTQYVATQVNQTTILVGALNPGMTRSSYIKLFGSAGAPSLAALGETLYMAYQGDTNDDTNNVFVARSPTPMNYGSWSLAGTSISTTSAPALAALYSTLYMACFQSDSTIYFGSSFGVEAPWTPLLTPPTLAVSGAPALAAFEGALYLAVTTSTTPPRIEVYRWSTSLGWSEAPVTTLAPLLDACPGGVCDPGLGVFNDRLFLACRDASSTNVWLCSTADGTTWTGYEELSLQLSNVATGGAPALGAAGDTLGLAFVDPQGTLFTWPTLVPHLVQAP